MTQAMLEEYLAANSYDESFCPTAPPHEAHRSLPSQAMDKLLMKNKKGLVMENNVRACQHMYIRQS
jgi:hypothetical protein